MNNFLRPKRFFLLVMSVLLPLFCIGQDKDFIPDPIDEILPDYHSYIFREVNENPPLDTSDMIRRDSRKSLSIKEQIIGGGDTLSEIKFFLWNNQGRLISYHQYSKDEIHSQGKFIKVDDFQPVVSDTFIYENGKKLIEMDRDNHDGTLDTLKLFYNRINKISG